LSREVKCALDIVSQYADEIADRLDLPREVAAAIALAGRDSTSEAIFQFARDIIETASLSAKEADIENELESLAVCMLKHRPPSVGEWQEKLFKLAEYRDIRTWEFNPEDAEKLDRYYAANILLLDCVSTARGVTNKTRQFIKDTILLPADEIRRIEASRQ
jgi:hypothetical protein